MYSYKMYRYIYIHIYIYNICVYIYTHVYIVITIHSWNSVLHLSRSHSRKFVSLCSCLFSCVFVCFFSLIHFVYPCVHVFSVADRGAHISSRYASATVHRKSALAQCIVPSDFRFPMALDKGKIKTKKKRNEKRNGDSATCFIYRITSIEETVIYCVREFSTLPFDSPHFLLFRLTWLSINFSTVARRESVCDFWSSKRKSGFRYSVLLPFRLFVCLYVRMWVCALGRNFASGITCLAILIEQLHF